MRDVRAEAMAGRRSYYLSELNEKDVTGPAWRIAFNAETRPLPITHGVWFTMNSSPPPPSFTLPPLTSKGRLPITPSPTPTPNEDGTFVFDKPARLDKGKGKAKEVYEVDEAQGRVSMYVRLFEGQSRLPALSQSPRLTAWLHSVFS